MQSKTELLDGYSDKLDEVETRDEGVAATCAIALAMPFLIILLADIRDVLWVIESKSMK